MKKWRELACSTQQTGSCTPVAASAVALVIFFLLRKVQGGRGLAYQAGAALVMGIALHPYLVGQPYRLRHLRRALEHIAAARRDVWLTTAGAVADHVIRAGS